MTATVQLTTPHITLYYATESHAEQAWHGIIKKIGHLLAPLMTAAPIIGTAEERSRISKNIDLSKRSLIEFCLSEASTLLSSSKFQLAIPGAIQALKFSKEIYGDMSVEVVEPYLILAQACLGMQSSRQAEEYLALAKWIVLNDEKCSDRIKSRLHQLLGRLHSSEGNLDQAKAEFASSIFYSAKCYGAEAIATSAGYFSLGDVFLSQGNVESALAFFDKVVDIWYKYLSALHTKALEAEQGGGERPESSPALEEPTEAQLTDGRNHLLEILENRRRLLGDNHIATGEVEYSLGLFEFFILGNEPSSASYMEMAHSIYDRQLGPSHASTLHVKAVLTLVKQNIYESEDDMNDAGLFSPAGNRGAPQTA
eukprot:CAMPEP_0185029050 /NCGR_PEP_ID=MMETSP1103-20130426/15131_1 /TAXON_ID=36769 /ORGANISM="Paraphysomonas bandaiensis, Strain Caron Lab Isolate" /LENGTH=367 /DNA_ID=CAMNT_0027563661 /DNA_START=129 /DNA_END=1232 /DNA_ORIENTATION=-